MTDPIWKPLKYAGELIPHHEINTIGEIRRGFYTVRVIPHNGFPYDRLIQSGTIPSRPDKDGYLQADIYLPDGTRITTKVHRAVIESHTDACLENLSVDHRNGVRDDNRLANLRPCTHAENIAFRDQRHEQIRANTTDTTGA